MTATGTSTTRPALLRVPLAALLCGSCAALGWWLDPLAWGRFDSLYVGICLGVVIYTFTYREARTFFGQILTVFLTSLPVVYVLVAITLVLAGWVSSEGQGSAWFVAAKGALLGTSCSLVWTMKGLANSMSQPGASTDTSDHLRYAREGAAFRLPIAVALGALLGLPHQVGPMIVVGALWGVIAGATVAVQTTLDDHEPVREGWWRLGLAELIVAVGLLLSLEISTFEHDAFVPTLSLLLPALLMCPATFATIDLGSRLRSSAALHHRGRTTKQPATR